MLGGEEECRRLFAHSGTASKYENDQPEEDVGNVRNGNDNGGSTSKKNVAATAVVSPPALEPTKLSRYCAATNPAAPSPNSIGIRSTKSVGDGFLSFPVPDSNRSNSGGKCLCCSGSSPQLGTLRSDNDGNSTGDQSPQQQHQQHHDRSRHVADHASHVMQPVTFVAVAGSGRGGGATAGTAGSPTVRSVAVAAQASRAALGSPTSKGTGSGRGDADKDAHITQLIFDKHEAKKRIAELEDAVASLLDQLHDTGCEAALGSTILRQPVFHSSVNSSRGVTKVFASHASDAEDDEEEVEVGSMGSERHADAARKARSSRGVLSLSPLAMGPSGARAGGHSSTEDASSSHFQSPLNTLTGGAGTGGGSSRGRAAKQSTVSTAMTNASGSTTSATVGASSYLVKSLHQSGALRSELEQITAWNDELVSTIEKLKRAMLKADSDYQAQHVLTNNEVSVYRQQNERLRQENEALKERVADDVLRQRQTNRIEVAMEKARIVGRLRSAGQQRLEFMEGVLMESHDDLYFRQRWDATVAPQRDLSFVFHFVSGTTFPPTGSEEFVFTVYQQVLYTTARPYGGFLAASFRGMEVFAFQDPAVALSFAKDCHEQIASLSWPARTESVPFFATIAEYGKVLFRGPRMHTCIYACSPEVEVDPVTGRSLFFGPQIRNGIETALELSPVGEIIVNDTWARLFCRAHRMQHDSAEPVTADVADVRNTLGPSWDVIGMPGTRGIVCSLLPIALKGRRGVQATSLSPTPKYPTLLPPTDQAVQSMTDSHKATATTVATSTVTNALVKILKGVAVDVEGNPILHNGSSTYSGSTNKRPLLQYSSAAGPMVPGAALSNSGCGISNSSGLAGPGMYNSTYTGDAESTSRNNATQMLEFYSLKREKENVTVLYRKVEKACAALERDAMQAEDRFEISRRKLPDPSEMAFVCTVDIGDDATWKRILLAGMLAEEYEVLRSTLRSYVHVAAKHYYGFLMNGNYLDVFTYVFREVEQALAFVSEVYIQVNRTGTKYAHDTRGTGQDVFLMRAGISGGPMSTIYRNLENGVLKCTGPVIRLSGTLCDLAQDGEILAMEDIIRTFHSKNDNLLDTQYNIVQQRGQFLSGFDAPAVVHSILPKPFAYRRSKLMNVEPHSKARAKGAARSAKAALMVQTRQYPRENVELFLTQQLERLERAEESCMFAEDDYERGAEITHPQVTLQNPWIVTSRPTAAAAFIQQMLQVQQQQREALPFGCMLVDTTADNEANAIPDLALMYCDMVGMAALKTELEEAGAHPGLAQEVFRHYNHVVQGVFTQFGGYVAKTNGKCAYVVLFDTALRALEAGVLVQQRLLESLWPVELRTIEPTLFVRDAATSTVLFNGPRAQVAVHLSNNYKWKRVVPPSSSDGAGTAAGSGTTTGGGGGTAASAGSAVGGSGASAMSWMNAKGLFSTAPPAAPASDTTGWIGIGGYPSGPSSSNNYGAAGTGGGGSWGNANGGGGGGINGTLVLVGSSVDVSGTAMDEVIVLGRHSHGGELRVSNALLDAVSKSSMSGKLLIGQLAMEVVPTPSLLFASASEGKKGSSSGRRSVHSGPGSGSGSSGGGGRKSVGSLPTRGSTASVTSRGRSTSGSGSSVISLAADGGRGPSSRSAGRSTISLSTVGLGRSQFKGRAQENLVCVAAVPRRLHGRLPLLLCQASFGAGGTAGDSHDVINNSINGSGGGGGGGPDGSNDGVGGGGDNAGRSGTSGGNSSNNSGAARRSSPALVGGSGSGRARAGSVRLSHLDRRSAAADRRTMPSPPLPRPLAAGVPQPPMLAGAAQNRWCMDPCGATEPLPKAARGSWDLANEEMCVSGHKEAENIQHMAEGLLKLYARVSFSAVGSGVSSPTTNPSSPLAAGQAQGKGGAAGSSAATAAAATSGNGAGASATSSDESVSPAGTECSSPVSATPQSANYQRFMWFSQELLGHLVAAFRVGNEGAKAPPLPKLNHGVRFTAAPGVVLGHDTDETNGRSRAPGTAAAGSGTPSLPAIPNARNGSNARGNGTFVPQPPPTSLGKKGAADTSSANGSGAVPSAGNSTGSAIASLLSPDAVRQPGGKGRHRSNDSYRNALDYLDEICRLFAIHTGTVLGKLTTVPAAPAPKPKPTFPSRATGRRF